MEMEHIFKLESEIRTRYQITIPEEIRTKAKLNVGDSFCGVLAKTYGKRKHRKIALDANLFIN